MMFGNRLYLSVWAENRITNSQVDTLLTFGERLPRYRLVVVGSPLSNEP